MIHQHEGWLLEHLFYEWSMLNFTISHVEKLPQGNEYNVYYESFTIHARLLSLFLTNNDTGNYGAGKFVKNFKSRKPNEIKPLTNKIDVQVMHSAERRPSGANGKLNSTECGVLFRWLETEFRDFFAGLPEDIRTKWKEKEKRATTIAIPTLSLSATNHVEGITTSVKTGYFGP
jgi:hypothetical protein